MGTGNVNPKKIKYKPLFKLNLGVNRDDLGTLKLNRDKLIISEYRSSQNEIKMVEVKAKPKAPKNNSIELF